LLVDLKLENIEDLDELIDMADLEGRAMLKLAGEDLDLGEPNGPVESLYVAIDKGSSDGIDFS
jgi:hypothetical protein